MTSQSPETKQQYESCSKNEYLKWNILLNQVLFLKKKTKKKHLQKNTFGRTSLCVTWESWGGQSTFGRVRIQQKPSAERYSTDIVFVL